MRKRKISFKAHGRRVTFMACVSGCSRGGHKKRVSSKRRAQGKALARKYGFVVKSGKLFRKSPKRGLVRVRVHR